MKAFAYFMGNIVFIGQSSYQRSNPEEYSYKSLRAINVDWIHGLGQDYCNAIVNALELLQSYSKPSKHDDYKPLSLFHGLYPILLYLSQQQPTKLAIMMPDYSELIKCQATWTL